MSNNYSLKAENGRVGYLVQQGNGYVLMHTPEESAKWMLEEGRVENMSPPEQPDYPIRVEINGNEYFFAGTWDEPSIFDERPKPRKRRPKDILLEER